MNTFEYIQAYENGKYNVKVEVDQSIDPLSRSSDVNIRVYFKSSAPYKVYTQRTGFGVTVDGEYIQCLLNGSTIQNTYILAAQLLRLTFVHDPDDGTKSLPISFTIGISSIDPATGEEINDVYLDFYHVFELEELYETLKIDGIIGDIGELQEVDVTGMLVETPYRYDVKVIVGNYIYEGSSLLDTDSWTIPDYVIAEYPDADSIPVTCELDSWVLGGGLGPDIYLGKDTKTFLCKVADSKKPTISVSVSDIMGHEGTENDPFLNKQSNLQISITASPKSGAQLASYSVVVGSKVFRSSIDQSPITIDTGTLELESASTSSIFVTASVTDSRGLSAENVQEFSTENYWAPYIDDIHIIRCDVFGNEDIKGDNFKFEWSGEHVYSGRTLSKTLRYRATGDPWTTVSNPVSGTIYYSIATVSPIEIEFIIYDGETSIVYKKQLSSASIIRHIRNTGKGAAFGDVCTADEFQVYWPARFFDKVHGLFDNLVCPPVGSNVNDILSPGVYYINSDYSSNTPTGDDGFMLVLKQPDAGRPMRMQFYITIGADPVALYRTNHIISSGDSAWYAWKTISAS